MSPVVVIEDEANVVHGAEVVAETVLLEHRGEPSSVDANDRPVVRSVDSEDEAGDRRLARPVGAHDRGDAALVELEVEAIEDHGVVVAARHLA